MATAADGKKNGGDEVKVLGVKLFTLPHYLPRALLSDFISLTLILIDEALTISYLFPIIAYQIAFVSRLASVDAAGYYSGLAISITNFGQFLTATLWGRFSDHFGRIFPFKLGLVFTGLSILLLAFSDSLWMLLLSRFITGLMNGDITVGKIYCGEVTNKHTSEIGWNLFGLGWNFGMIFGPLLGGIFYSPPQYLLEEAARERGISSSSSGSDAAHPLSSHSIINLDTSSFSLWEKYPALLPTMVVILYKVAAYYRVSTSMRESHRNPKPFTMSNLMVFVKEYFGIIVEEEEEVTAAANKAREEGKERQSSEDIDSKQQTQQRNLEGRECDEEEHLDDDEDHHQGPPCNYDPKTFGYKELLRDEALRTTPLLYVVMSAADFGFNELVPLWMQSRVASGGLGLTPAVVGMIIFISNFIGLSGNSIFPWVMKKLGPQKRLAVYQANILWWAVLTAYLPFSTLAFPSTWSATVMVNLLFVGRILTDVFCFGLVFIFISKTTPKPLLGHVMGKSQSLGCLMRAIAPSVLTPFFAWTLSLQQQQRHSEKRLAVANNTRAQQRVADDDDHSFFGFTIQKIVFGYYSSFILLALVLLVVYWMSRRIKPSQVA